MKSLGAMISVLVMVLLAFAMFPAISGQISDIETFSVLVDSDSDFSEGTLTNLTTSGENLVLESSETDGTYVEKYSRSDSINLDNATVSVNLTNSTDSTVELKVETSSDRFKNVKDSKIQELNDGSNSIDISGLSGEYVRVTLTFSRTDTGVTTPEVENYNLEGVLTGSSITLLGVITILVVVGVIVSMVRSYAF